jgi:hypothetical protein
MNAVTALRARDIRVMAIERLCGCLSTTVSKRRLGLYINALVYKASGHCMDSQSEGPLQISNVVYRVRS